MIEPNVKYLLPRFLLQDRNGKALAAAIGKGLTLFCLAAQKGMDITLNVDEMPEWRLDEMAAEMGCVYDKSADLERKRGWIRTAYLDYLHIGTPAAIAEYLATELENVRVEEWWQYGGSPYHFRVTAQGVTAAKESWANAAVARLKNLRSAYDGIFENTSVTLEMSLLGKDIIYADRPAAEDYHTGPTQIYGG